MIGVFEPGMCTQGVTCCGNPSCFRGHSEMPISVTPRNVQSMKPTVLPREEGDTPLIFERHSTIA